MKDYVRVVVDDNYVPPDRRHEFLQADGRWQKCAKAPYCRECNREEEEADGKV